MSLFIHNIKVAIRNLMKYKLQTLISVLSIAIGIVTLAFTHSALENYQIPPICKEEYYHRAYLVYLRPIQGTDRIKITPQIVTALKGNGGLSHAEKTVFAPVDWSNDRSAEFHLADSTIRKGNINGIEIDPEYAVYAGLRSAVTGERIKRLKPGEAMVSEDFAKKVFADHNPIGAVQIQTNKNQPIPVTIVDIFRRTPLNMRNIQNDKMYFSTQPEMEMLPEVNASWTEIVLKENSTPEELLEELNLRLRPLDIKAEIRKQFDFEDNKIISYIRTFFYFIGCMILFAAMIGFLRIQIQLIWMRRRELALRVVNGATGFKLFKLLMVESTICIFLSIAVAILMGELLQEFLNERLAVYFSITGVRISNLWIYSLLTGGFLLLISICIISYILWRRCHLKNCLAVTMRRSRNHIFRNVMLGIQLTICLVFICGSFILINCGVKILKSSLIPRYDGLFKESLYINPSLFGQEDPLIAEIGKMPEHDKLIEMSNFYFPIKEIRDNDEYKEKFSGQTNFNVFCTPDTALLATMGIEVKWFNNGTDRTDCLLLQKDLYHKLKGIGAIDSNSLTLEVNSERYTGLTLPIAGVYDNMPYQSNENNMLAITPRLDRRTHAFIAIPKSGKGEALKRKAMEAAERLRPEAIDKGISNYRQTQSFLPAIMETVMSIGWILVSVSLIICVMGVYSIITLDTRTRRKEVAIRKVNGAKSKDIYRMFGKVYVWLILVSMLIGMPLCVLFNKGVQATLLVPLGIHLSPLRSILFGCLTVAALIFVIVFWQINRVMQTDPAKIIAKE